MSSDKKKTVKRRIMHDDFEDEDIDYVALGVPGE